MNPRSIAVIASIWIILTVYAVVSGNLNLVHYANGLMVVLVLIALTVFTNFNEE